MDTRLPVTEGVKLDAINVSPDIALDPPGCELNCDHPWN